MQLLAQRWTPDRLDPHNMGLVRVNNAIPHTNGFSVARDFSAITSSLPDKVVGATFGRKPTGTEVLFAGTASGLYRLLGDNATWCDVSPSGSSFMNVNSWEFSQVDNLILATGKTQGVYSFNLDGNTGACDDSRELFVALSGDPPKADYISSFRQFTVLGGIEDYPSRLQWSGFNNATLWSPSRFTQSDFQDLPSRNGKVQALVPGNYMVVFQEKSIHIMSYVGPPTVFRFDEVDLERGTDAPLSVCSTGETIFFHSGDGFFRLDGGRQLTPIGEDRVDKWLEDNVSHILSLRGVVDPENHAVFWSFDGRGGGRYTHILVYRWDVDSWGLIEQEHDYAVAAPAFSQTLDAAAFNDLYGNNIDGSYQVSFDSPLWLSGRLNLRLFNEDHKMGSLSGVPKQAVFESGYRMIGRGGYHKIIGVTPIVGDLGTYNPEADQTVRVDVRDRIQQRTASDSQVRSLNKWGNADIHLRGSYFKIRTTLTGGFHGFSGWDYDATPDGLRGRAIR